MTLQVKSCDDSRSMAEPIEQHLSKIVRFLQKTGFVRCREYRHAAAHKQHPLFTSWGYCTAQS
jgi:hypothetical protein